MEELTFGRVLRSTSAALEAVSGADAVTEARELVAAASGRDRRDIAALRAEPFPASAHIALEAMIRARLDGQPLQYIVGTWDFMGLEFKVDKRALIPRQDTETLCEAALPLIREHAYKSCLDMCCGTGCIGVALAVLAGVSVTLADISNDALALALENADMHGVRAKALQTDLFRGVEQRYDIIVCNPPYLSDADMASLQRELAFEPQNALYGGADGLDFYRRLSREAPGRLAPGGALLMEVGRGQAADVEKMFVGSHAVRDINGIERTVIWIKRS